MAALASAQLVRLAALVDDPRVTGTRQHGTVTALEVADRSSDYLSPLGPRLAASFRHDVLLRPLGNTVSVMPPYATTDDQLDAVYAAIGRALDGLVA